MGLGVVKFEPVDEASYGFKIWVWRDGLHWMFVDNSSKNIYSVADSDTSDVMLFPKNWELSYGR